MDPTQPYFRKAYENTKSNRDVNIISDEISNNSFELAPYPLSTETDIEDNQRWIYVIGVLSCLIGIVIISVGVLKLVKDKNMSAMHYWLAGCLFITIGIGLLYKGIKTKYYKFNSAN